jgi:hypothetical protein
MPHQGIELGTVLPPDLHHVFESPIGHQDHPGSLPFQQPVCGNGGTVKKAMWLWASQELSAPRQDGLRRIGWGGRYFEGRQDAVGQQEEVSEGAPGINGENHG